MAILRAIPSNDHTISSYERCQGGKILEDAIKDQQDFVSEIVKYAELIIKELKS